MPPTGFSPRPLDAVTIAGIFTTGEVCMLYRLMRIAPHVTRMIPRHMRWRLGGIAAVLAYWFWPAKRLATQKNMSIVLGLPLHHPQVRRTARLSWYNYGRVVADYFDLANHSAADYLHSFDNTTYSVSIALDVVDSLRAQGHGIIISTAHYGNWDAAGIMIGSRYPTYVIAERLGDERQNRLFQEERRKFGLNVLMIEDGIRPLMRLLKQGEIVGTPIDRPVSPKEGVPVQFFGRTAFVPRGLGALAVKLNVVILPGFVWYNDHGGFNAKAFTPTFIEKTGDDDADIIHAMQVMYDALEAIIRSNPTQWYMFRPFWPEEITDHSGVAPKTAQADPTGARAKRLDL
ncbi:MAG TPA: lysophospholipid acyltransferase family protein [Ktedonobacterales bacterium]|nr:lysophospholipid acyltransferase family protein [Ktedonobacterales bacterium]